MNDAACYFDGGAECVLVGTLLNGGDVTDLPDLTAEDFSTEALQQVWISITRVQPEEHLEAASVAHDLTARGKLGAVGGLSALMDLKAQGLLRGESIAGFVRMVREKSIVRGISRRAQEIDREIALHGLNGNAGALAKAAHEIATLAETATASARVGIRDLVELPGVGETHEHIEFVREPEFPVATVTGLTGAAGSGKTSLLAAVARDALRAGRMVIVLDRENPRPVVLALHKRIGLQDDPLLRYWGNWVDGGPPLPDSQIIMRAVAAMDPKPLVIVDSLVAFLEGDENSAADMRRFMDRCRRLASLGATVGVGHHDGKAETSRDFRGSSDFKSSCDQCFHVTNVSADPGRLDRIKLRCYKSRIGFSGELVYSYANGLFIRDERSDAPARTVADQLTGLLREHPGVGTKQFEDLAAKANLGRNRARDFLGNGVLAGLVRRETGARNQFRHYLAGGGE